MGEAINMCSNFNDRQQFRLNKSMKSYTILLLRLEKES